MLKEILFLKIHLYFWKSENLIENMNFGTFLKLLCMKRILKKDNMAFLKIKEFLEEQKSETKNRENRIYEFL
jgi:hypothetical protein